MPRRWIDTEALSIAIPWGPVTWTCSSAFGASGGGGARLARGAATTRGACRGAGGASSTSGSGGGRRVRACRCWTTTTAPNAMTPASKRAAAAMNG